MVYTSVTICYGLCFTKKQLIDIYQKNPSSFVEKDDDSYYIDIMNEFDLDHINNVCCLKDEEQNFFVYVPIRVYDRTENMSNFTRRRKGLPVCNDCDEDFMCETCLGMTENGYYNVEKLRKEPTICENFCFYCGHDNKAKDVLKENNKCEKCNEQIMTSLYSRCVLEIIQNKNYGTLIDFIDNDTKESVKKLASSKYYLEMEKAKIKIIQFKEKYDLNEKGKLYYMIDDCFSCT